MTVGAIDSPRDITNQVSVDCSTTNAIFLTETSDSNQVVYFSSAGNVNPTIEGDFGRFKPDVVAPGVFIVSTRSSNYQDPTNDQFVTFVTRPGQLINPGETIPYIIQVPDNSQYMWIEATPNTLSPVPLPPLNVSAQPFSGGATVSGFSPLLVSNQLSPGLWEVDLSSSKTNRPVNFDLNVFIVRTNYLCDYYTVLSNMNYALQPYYRYESGTSMSAPAAAGTLALIQQYFIESNHITPTPALLKALLINGARSLNHIYDFNTRPSSANIQGWGLINLPNSLPQGSNGVSNMAYFDQSQSPPLRTGESNSYTVSLGSDTNALGSALRVTLVWTDPPGNPAAGVALVNDLDLIVTDANGAVYVGNNFQSGDIFTESNNAAGLAAADNINNVENVYIGAGNGPLAPPYTITVRGHRVNVNAVTTQTNNIEQDYALVVSSDDANLASSLTVTPSASTVGVQPLVTVSSNSVALLNERVGANSPYDYNFASGATNGTLAQWHFFVFHNDTATYTNNATNVAFITFLPPNLSIPRVSQEADIDLYVATNPADAFNLTNLDPAVIARAVSDGTVSRNRGGTEAVVFSNSPANSTYYIGVKSEDQQAATFGFLGVASQTPFSDQMPNGDVVAHGIPLPLPIPDGSFDHPGTTNILAVIEGGEPIHIRHVVVTNGIAHRHPTDLVGTLTFMNKAVTLNNQTGDSTNYVVAYDDEPEGPSSDPNIPTVFTDGPGSLRDYIGLQVGDAGVWRLDETDNALGQVGSVTRLDILMEHQPPNTGTFAIDLEGFGSYYGYVVVPTDATNLSIAVTYQNVGDTGPVSIYATNDPNVNIGDTLATLNITPPGGVLNINSASNPPISGGVWYYLIQNNSASSVALNVTIGIQQSLTPNFVQTFTNNTVTPIVNDAHTKSQLCIDAASLAQAVVSLNVGVRISDPDVDDLVLHLTSPMGTSVLLFENRGGPSVTNLGLDTSNANQFIYTTFTEDTNLTDTLVKFTPEFGVSNANGFVSLAQTGFESDAVGSYGVGKKVGGWDVITNQVAVLRDANANTGSQYLALTTGGIAQTFPTVAGDSYQVIYHARGSGMVGWWPADRNANDVIGGNNGTFHGTTYGAGKVGEAFVLDAVASNYVSVPDSPALRPAVVTVEGWISLQSLNTGNLQVFAAKPYGLARVDSFAVWYASGAMHAVRGIGTTDSPEINFPWSPALGSWHHIAYSYDPNVSQQILYLDGKQMVTGTVSGAIVYDTRPFQMGMDIDNSTISYPFDGSIDETAMYSRALSPTEINAIYQAGSAGKGSTNSVFPNLSMVVQGISTNTLIDSTNGWLAFTNVFTAASSQTTVAFVGNSANGILLDDISVSALPATNYNNYFKPEESLSTFVGENPVGCWTLDVWDTRSDAPATGLLESWTLDMTFSSTNVNLIVLTNHVPYTNTIAAGASVYFGFDVSNTANFATNTLINTNGAGGNLNLIFNQNALPTGSGPGDVVFVSLPGPAPDSGSTILDTGGSVPPLLPGRRYFLTVQNTSASAHDYSVQVDTDESVVAVTPLINAVPLATNIATKLGQYYSFDVPPGAEEASFQILNPTGEVDLYARYGVPVPGPTSFDYISAVAGANDQSIIVYTNSPFSTNSSPIPLTPGRWYLAAFTPGSVPVNYTISASVITNTNAITIIPLANGVLTNGTAPPGLTNVFYSFSNNPSSAGVAFVLTNFTANLDLIVGLNSLPSPQHPYAGSFNAGTTPELVRQATNGIWYLAVVNNTSANVNYGIRADVIANGPVVNYPAVSQTRIIPGFGFTLYWNSVPGDNYEVDYSTNLMDWTQAITFQATNTQSSFTDFTPINSQPYRYYRLQQAP
ncbi:MAG TPA: LamG-like jellyroll fold domain-containing protein [Verrucomicrobiae bacterium]|nr:LamG-like jellyroll fold domain-containing protein [Verrucomicrobiae bacterium]